jgi:hypothetical protein
MNPFWGKHKDIYVFPDSKPFEFPRKKSFEWYVDALIKKINAQPKVKIILQKELQGVLKEFLSSGNGGSGENGEGGGGEGKEGGEGGEGKEGGESGEEKGGNKGQEQDEDEKQGNAGSKKAGRALLVNHVLPPQSFEDDSSDGSLDSIPNDKSVEGQLSLADELRGKLKALITKAVEEHNKNRGTLPAGLQEKIDALMKDPIIPFTKILRNWVVATQKYRRKRSPMRMRRRTMGIPELCSFPGSSKERKFTVVWCIDTSGSMGSDELMLGLNELRGLQKADPEILIHIIEADASVEHEYILDRPETKINYDVHGRGGTAFDPALIRAQQLRPDICFYFTDGYAPAPKLESRVSCPFAWIITPRGVCPDKNWGHSIETKNY